MEDGALEIGVSLRESTRSTADEYAEAAAEGLYHSDCKVERIKFWDLGISDTVSLGAALPHTSTLQVLDLRRNRISGVGARAIAQGASRCPSLKTIILQQNPTIGPAGIQAFAEFISPALESLNMRDTGIADQGMPHVATLLRFTPSLQVLDLSWNRVSDTLPIADALSVNSTLEDLCLSHNLLGRQGVRGLAAAICRNRELRCVRLPAIDEGARHMLLTALSHNHTIKYLMVGPRDLASDTTERKLRMSQRLAGLLRQFPDYPRITPRASSSSHNEKFASPAKRLRSS